MFGRESGSKVLRHWSARWVVLGRAKAAARRSDYCNDDDHENDEGDGGQVQRQKESGDNRDDGRRRSYDGDGFSEVGILDGDGIDG